MNLRSRIMLASAGAAVVGALAATAHATMVLLLSREELVARSAMVARVTVGKAFSGEAPDGSAILTRTTVSIKECLKGPCPASIEIEQLGGQYKGKTQRVLGDGTLRAGEDAIVFLKTGEKGTAYLTALALSVYHVDGSGLARRDLDGMSLVARRDGKLTPVETKAEPPVPVDQLEADITRIAKEK